ncbi:hypothetical protein DFH07DRAFT_952231 [Mycena maculata]|uniref:Uncharacterized protein n=1 Tax=Mycena maculata TaxID=230809 RepID=A0AAD7K0G4_9AGAR|nr:hypothetical protein DFH07DRAFT_952231 [Mycena maculata]
MLFSGWLLGYILLLGLVSAEQALTIFLDSINVQGIILLVNDTNTVAWRLRVTPPTDDRQAWAHLRRLFGKLQVMTALYGTARLQRPFRCRICPGIDHPTPLCPLPNLPGWLGPTHATIAALESASRAGGSGPNSGDKRGSGAKDKKFRGDGKKGNGPKGKGKGRDFST